MAEILRSIEGSLIGLDKDDNLLVKGGKLILDYAGTPTEIESGGAGAPSLIRQRYVIRDGIDGIVSGDVDDAQAAVNLAAMQAIVDEADGNAAAVEMDQETIEIAGGPLIIRSSANGMIWDSPTFARLTQRTNNVPVLQIGDTSNVCQNLDFSGINLHYLNDQAGNTSANACVIYNQWKSTIGKIQVANTLTTARPYRGIYIPQSQTLFSCNFHNLYSFQAHYSLLHISNFGTGNAYTNVYLSGVGSDSEAQSVSFPLLFDMGGGQIHDSVFNQLNLEWCITNTLMRFNNIRGPVINSLHMEHNHLSGAGASFLYNVISNVQINSMLMLDNHINDALVTDSIPSIFKYFNNGRTNVDTFTWISNSAGYVDMPFYLHYQADSDGFTTQPARTTIRNFQLVDASGTSLRDNVRIDRVFGGTDIHGGSWGNTQLQGAAEVIAGGAMTRLIESDRRVDASKTIYGQESLGGTVTVPGSLSGNITLTLSNRMGPTDSRWGNVPIPEGGVISVVRGGTHVNTTTVNNHDGTTIGTFSNGGATTRLNFYMSAGDWVAA